MADIQQPPEPGRRREPLLARVLGAGARSGFRVAEATGIDQAIEELASDAVVRALESPAAERAIARALESAAVERSVVRAIDSEMIDRVWERLLASDEVQKLVERIAQAPEVRQAIAYQGVGLIDDIGAQVGRIARRIDSTLERVARALLRRPRRAEAASQGGLFTRGLALALDAALLNGIFFAVSSLFALGLDAVFGLKDGFSGFALVLGTTVWVVAGSAYLVSFWSLSGETPGMRFLDLRLSGPDGPRLGFRRSMRRLAGVAVSVLSLGLGFLVALFDERRRTFADRLAGTEVRYLPPRRAAPWSTP
ncbi:MAG: RDD family protein [Solirubrobacterales bacterium]